MVPMREKPMCKKSPETIEAERQKTRSLYMAIGQFMFEFSQLEFIIRHALGAALDLNETGANAPFDIVTSPYDFITLCNVTKAIFLRTIGCEEQDRKEIEDILNACMKLNNEERVPIAHGTWFIDESGLGARHVPRTKLDVTIKYSRISDIDAAAQKAATLRSRLIKFLCGPIPPRDL
ncbi:MAG TPA: hypothetical protein VIF40_07525 [Methylosinus sp.]|jgi:hypothetical protein|uniref:hypothetical protein n=1 Tax=Methylosinus sp. TaxID=427 RepID=UPI002F91E94F